jgi:long-chain acyl-CoA synthetase
MMFSLSKAWAGRPLMRFWRDGIWHPVTWGEFGRMAASAARHFRAAGIAPGDRVLLCMDNRPEFLIAEVALMAIRAVPVPAYTTNTVDDHAHLLRDSGASAAVVSFGALADKVLTAAAKVSGVELLVSIDPPSADPGAVKLLPWADMITDQAPPSDIAAEAALIPATALACLVYTSGTGGAPRGVMLPHRCILSNCAGAFDLLRPLGPKDEVYLSYLPVAHSYEHTVGQYFLASLGTEIYYSRGVEYLAADMAMARPTFLAVVPRVLDVIRTRILAQLKREASWKQALFQKALTIGLKRADGERLNLAEQLLDPVLDKLVRSKVQGRFGGRIKNAMSGGARLDPEVGRFFLALGLSIMQGYGQTEAGPVISANPPDAIRIDTVGTVLNGVDLKIADDGEILVRGGLVMDGYWGRPEDTAAAIEDGWLHTGDIGELDNGYLRITDRKKDIIVLAGGENVSPAKIEGMLMREPEIAQAVVTGEGRGGLSALVVPADGHDDVAVALAISRTNHRLSVTERIRKHAIVGPFTMENGLLTPSHKIRRVLVMRANADIVARLH